ncbi:MAG TPA: mechanosensitive ion channel family protein [Bryobacteraceae bacterium]|nr:mechanosensitive ion channel family protein [Bryobacteraceae bacterium]
MVAIRAFLAHNWMELIFPLGVLVVTLALGYAVKRILFRLLDLWAARSRSRVTPTLVDVIRGPFMIWVLILALHLATQSSDLPHRATLWVGRVLLVLWFLSLTIVASRLARDFIRFYAAGVSGALPVTLTQTLAQLGVVILALVVLLNQLGIPVTPILTALGVGGLAVALALQDTLSNLFAGFYIAVAGQIRPGDYIKLNTGEEGYVADISWRNTTIRALAYNLIIVPNAKLWQAVVTNYYLPEKRIAISVQVGVSYQSDPDQVERLLLEEALRAAAELGGALLADPQPSVRFDPGFGDSSLGFTLNCHVAEFTDQYLVRHELRKRILKRFRAEGIDMPFPTRTVYLFGGPAADGQTQKSSRGSVANEDGLC